MTNMINLRGPVFKKLELKRQQRTRNKNNLKNIFKS